MTFTAAFPHLYAAQTMATGVAIQATVTGYATLKPAILSRVSVDNIYVSGGGAESGEWSLQMLVSDFASEPPKRTAVTCNGEAEGHSLAVLNVERSGGIYTINLADFAAVTR